MNLRRALANPLGTWALFFALALAALMVSRLGLFAWLRDTRVASQIDIGPTLVHLLGLEVEHPMTGRDLLALPTDDPGLALMQYDNQHGFRYGDRLVVHQPGQPAIHFTVGSDDQLKPAPPDAELARDALAHALWPAETYNRGLYRLPAETYNRGLYRLPAERGP